MIGFDIIFYVSLAYLSILIIVELFLFDIPLRITNNKDKKDKAVAYYYNRKNIFLYKITPLFCVLQVISIIANIVLHHSSFLISSISIFALAFLVYILLKKTVKAVNEMKNNENTDTSNNDKELASIFLGHMTTLLTIITMLFFICSNSD